MLADADLACTCIADEAANQPHEGKVAVGIVILNRQALRYASDGTIVGTVLHKWAFSGFWAQMVAGVYKQTEFDLDQAETEAQTLFENFSDQPGLWSDCQKAWADAQAWRAGAPGAMSFMPGPQFKKLTQDTVLYYNPAACPQPIWATTANFVAQIFAHSFYKDGGA